MKETFELTLTGNFQFDSGLLGFIRILEKFYPHKYEISNDVLKFEKSVLDNFGMAWFQMILTKNDFFNNSVYKKDGKKASNTFYRDLIEKINKSNSSDEQLEGKKKHEFINEINFNTNIEIINTEVKKIFMKTPLTEQTFSKIEETGEVFLNKLKNIISTSLGIQDEKNERKIEDLIRKLKDDLSGRISTIKKGSWIRKVITSFNLNKGIFNTGNKDDIFKMIEKFQDDYISPIKNLKIKDETTINCDFCGKYQIDISKRDEYSIDRTHLFGAASKTSFSNLYWFSQADIFFCPLCELIMLCTVFGFNDKERNRDLEDTNKIFIHSPSLKSLIDTNHIAEKYFSFEKFLDQYLDRIDTIDKKMKYILENILFVDLEAAGQKTKSHIFHINSKTAEFIIKHFKILKKIKGKIKIYNDKKTLDIRYEILKSILQGRNNLQDLFTLIVLEITKKEKGQSIFISGLALLNHKLKGGTMSRVIIKFYNEGLDFSKNLPEWNKKRGTVYSLMQHIRGNDRNGFIDKLFLLYLSFEKTIPTEIRFILKNEIDFQDIGNAFIAGLLTERKAVSDDTYNSSSENVEEENNNKEEENNDD